MSRVEVVADTLELIHQLTIDGGYTPEVYNEVAALAILGALAEHERGDRQERGARVFERLRSPVPAGSDASDREAEGGVATVSTSEPAVTIAADREPLPVSPPALSVEEPEAHLHPPVEPTPEPHPIDRGALADTISPAPAQRHTMFNPPDRATHRAAVTDEQLEEFCRTVDLTKAISPQMCEAFGIRKGSAHRYTTIARSKGWLPDRLPLARTTPTNGAHAEPVAVAAEADELPDTRLYCEVDDDCTFSTPSFAKMRSHEATAHGGAS